MGRSPRFARVCPHLGRGVQRVTPVIRGRPGWVRGIQTGRTVALRLPETTSTCPAWEVPVAFKRRSRPPVVSRETERSAGSKPLDAQPDYPRLVNGVGGCPFRPQLGRLISHSRPRSAGGGGIEGPWIRFSVPLSDDSVDQGGAGPSFGLRRGGSGFSVRNSSSRIVHGPVVFPRSGVGRRSRGPQSGRRGKVTHPSAVAQSMR